MSRRRGPPPLPAAMAKARGYKQRKCRRTAGKETKVVVSAPNMPAHIRHDKTARACWERLRPRLLKLKVLTKNDDVALEGLCIAYARALEADEAVEKYGMVTNDKFSGLKANPAVGMSRAAWAEVRKFAQEFGLTPSSRTRVREAPSEDNEEDSKQETAEGFLFKGSVVGSIGA